MTTSSQALAHALRTEIGIKGTEIWDNRSNQILLSSSGWPLLPIINGQAVIPQNSGKSWHTNVSQVILTTTEASPVDDITLYYSAADEHVDFWCEFAVAQDCELNALTIFPPGSGINMYDVVNFRNRHFTANTWPELLIGQGFETTTYSNDWQFSPHPTALLFRKNEIGLFAGFMDLQASFGMRLEMKQSVVGRWDVDFGPVGNGLKLKTGETFRSGRMRLVLRHDRTPHEMFAEFGAMLVDEGKISAPAAKKRHSWWKAPIYCTWGDQWLLANSPPPTELQDQTSAAAMPATECLTEDLVRRAVSIIRKEQLPMRTILLDEGWAMARGDWRPHPKRFPNLRGLVDELHGAGFKVMVWWNWAEVADDAEVEPWQLAGQGWRNKHGARWRDYSNPYVQENYLKPLFRTLFSSGEGCFDLDGVKTDFLADKVQPETPLTDPSWRGEETYFQQVTRLFHQEMRKHKPDAMHMGCAGNYWLADYIETNRTYDVHTSNWLEHEERARMLACTCPGAILSYDMTTGENLERWIASAAKMGAAVQIGNVISNRPNILSPTQAADADYFDLLRTISPRV